MNDPDQHMAEGVTRAGRREWIGWPCWRWPASLYAMDLTVLHLAVPALSEDLRPSSAQLLWITDIYGFMIAGSGHHGDTWRPDRPSAAAPDRRGRLRGGLGAGRVLHHPRDADRQPALLGIAGATLAPSTLSLIFSMFHDHRQRTTAIGIGITSFSAGGAIGRWWAACCWSTWWGSVFLLTLPVMALLLVLGRGRRVP